ncbi:type II and III secretion system protein family protein [Gemmatimonas sp.]|jgi:Flp pilus assembly secretin CpaC|uniref:type II and III secretion system protein family protein n=1 Tax=Gemmatimonas sp. TaxID=1962908 RepID=UPI0037BFB537
MSRVTAASILLAAASTTAVAQGPSRPVTDTILRLSLSAGRSLPLTTADPITRVAVANPEIADVVVVSERDLVINGKVNGETDIVLWSGTRPRVHYRVTVRAPSDRRMVMLAVRLAEVRRDVLRQVGVSALHTNKDGGTRTGTGLFRNDNAIGADGKITIPGEGKFLSILSDLGTKQFLAFLETEEQSGNARLLAEPNLLAADRDSASFLAGGELPIPVVQAGVAGAGQAPVTIQYREFGIRLRFSPDIVSDSIIKLFVRPEVSSLDYGNAILLNGFRIPAFRTRRVESTVDIRRDQSIIISGLFNEDRERVRTGVPLLMNVPILGALFSSSRWQNSETELLVIVTPTIIDPAAPGGELILPIRPDSRTPALDALRKRLPADTLKRP